MKIVPGVASLPQPIPRAVLTIGNFDGVHVGHQAIMKLTIEKARARKGEAIAFTFRPHPQIALRPEANIPLINTYDEKLELLSALDLDRIVEQPFSREFSTTTPEQFFHEMLHKRLGAEAIVVGYDFAFGRGREGSLEALGELCRQAGVELTVVPAMRVTVGDQAEVVSSSRIRQHLLAGEVDFAAQLMGRPFFYRGVVIRGEGRGRKIGFPTANLQLDQKLHLPNGVYATEAYYQGRKYASVTNIGVRPTFHADASAPLIETHLIDTFADLYGGALEIRFVKRLRAEKKFSGVEELTAQISKDIEAARGILGVPSKA